MCGPMAIPIAAAAMTVAGSVAGMVGKSKVQDARNAAVSAENARQRGIEAQSAGLFNDTLAKGDRATQDKNVAMAADKRFQADQGRLTAAPQFTVPTGQAPGEIGSAFARALRGALNRNIDRADRTAKVNAYGDANAGLGTDLLRSGQWQTIFGNRAVNSANLLPLELDSANNAGDTWSGIGQLLGGAGRAIGSFGGGGMGGGGSSFFPGFAAEHTR